MLIKKMTFKPVEREIDLLDDLLNIFANYDI